MTVLSGLLVEFLETTPDAAVVVDPGGLIIAVNAQLVALLGYERGELLGQPVEMLVPVGQRSGHAAVRGTYHQHPETRPMGSGDMTLYALRRDGTELPVEIALAPIAGTDSLVWAAVRDVSGRLAVEARLARLAAIVDSTDDAVIAKTLDGVITDWNHGAERLYGYAADEVIGQSLEVIVPVDRRPEFSAVLARIAGGERLDRYDTTRQHKTGRLIPVALTVSPITDSAGRLVGASTIARDLTDRLRADRLQQVLLDHMQRRRQAVQVNDNILQHLVVAHSYLHLEEVPAAKLAVSAALDQAKTLIADLIGPEAVNPGELSRTASPPQIADTVPPTDKVPEAHNNKHQAVTVLIIDDDRAIRRLIRMVLEGAVGFDVVGEASDGSQGQHLARTWKPDLVLLDLSMPGMDGLSALPLIRRSLPRAVIVVLSAFGADLMASTALDRGADAYVEKGNLTTDLIATLQELLPRKVTDLGQAT